MSSSRTISVSVCALCSYAFRSVAGIAVYVGLYRTWSLDVADDGAGGVVHELNTDLGNTSTGTCEYVRTSFLSYMLSRHRSQRLFRGVVHTGTAQNAGDLNELDWDLGSIHFGEFCRAKFGQYIDRQQFARETYMTDWVVDSGGVKIGGRRRTSRLAVLRIPKFVVFRACQARNPIFEPEECVAGKGTETRRNSEGLPLWDRASAV